MPAVEGGDRRRLEATEGCGPSRRAAGHSCMLLGAFVVNFHTHDLRLCQGERVRSLHCPSGLITYAQLVRTNNTCQTSASQSDLRLSSRPRAMDTQITVTPVRRKPATGSELCLKI